MIVQVVAIFTTSKIMYYTVISLPLVQMTVYNNNNGVTNIQKASESDRRIAVDHEPYAPKFWLFKFSFSFGLWLSAIGCSESYMFYLSSVLGILPHIICQDPQIFDLQSLHGHIKYSLFTKYIYAFIIKLGYYMSLFGAVYLP